MAATILITGGTGAVGGELIRQLLAAGVSLRALVRSAEKGAALAARGVEVFEGDFAQPETLPPALAGIERVFLLSNAHERQAELQSNLIGAALEAGARHIVKLSALGSAPDSPITLAAQHARTEQQLKDSGLEWTILQPHSFMQNLLGNAGSIVGEGAFRGAAGEGKIAPVDVRDIAAVAAATLTEAGHAGQTYLITGPETLTYAQIAEQLGAAIGKPVRYVDIPREQYVAGLKGYGVPAFLAEDLGTLQQIFAAGYGDVVTDVVQRVAKKAPISFAQFARDYADAFRS
jgi:uncharacterized protein YbjT (DUF2867 family)